MPDEREITILGRWKLVLRRRQQPPREWVELVLAWRRFVAVMTDKWRYWRWGRWR